MYAYTVYYELIDQPGKSIIRSDMQPFSDYWKGCFFNLIINEISSLKHSLNRLLSSIKSIINISKITDYPNEHKWLNAHASLNIYITTESRSSFKACCTVYSPNILALTQWTHLLLSVSSVSARFSDVLLISDNYSPQHCAMSISLYILSAVRCKLLLPTSAYASLVTRVRQ